jgi:hypothetical protein
MSDQPSLTAAAVRESSRLEAIGVAQDELAAKAAIRSRSAEPGGRITVHADICPGNHVRIEAREDGRPSTQPSSDADRLRGLDIIRALAGGWGITETRAGRTTWRNSTGQPHEQLPVRNTPPDADPAAQSQPGQIAP